VVFLSKQDKKGGGKEERETVERKAGRREE
jgi:hypothetical protein